MCAAEGISRKRVVSQSFSPGSGGGATHRRAEHHIDEEAEPQNMASRRPQRATAVAATLRIRGRLERADIVHDPKAYMESLSSAVTLALKQEQQNCSLQIRKARQAERDVHKDRSVSAAIAPQRSIRTAYLEGGRRSGAVTDEACVQQHPALAAEKASNGETDSGAIQGPEHTQLASQRQRADQRRKNNKPSTSLRATPKRVHISGGKQKSVPVTHAKALPQPGAKLIPAQISKARRMANLEQTNSDVPSESDEWTNAEVARLLHVCTHMVRPDTTNFWIKVAKKMPGELQN